MSSVNFDKLSGVEFFELLEFKFQSKKYQIYNFGEHHLKSNLGCDDCKCNDEHCCLNFLDFIEKIDASDQQVNIFIEMPYFYIPKKSGPREGDKITSVLAEMTFHGENGSSGSSGSNIVQFKKKYQECMYHYGNCQLKNSMVHAIDLRIEREVAPGYTSAEFKILTEKLPMFVNHILSLDDTSDLIEYFIQYDGKGELYLKKFPHVFQFIEDMLSYVYSVARASSPTSKFLINRQFSASGISDSVLQSIIEVVLDYYDRQRFPIIFNRGRGRKILTGLQAHNIVKDFFTNVVFYPDVEQMQALSRTMTTEIFKAVIHNWFVLYGAIFMDLYIILRSLRFDGVSVIIAGSVHSELYSLVYQRIFQANVILKGEKEKEGCLTIASNE